MSDQAQVSASKVLLTPTLNYLLYVLCTSVLFALGSEPLLKFRPRSDMINTLVHEMIHAFLFVTKSIQDRESHGPNFQFHMRRC